MKIIVRVLIFIFLPFCICTAQGGTGEPDSRKESNPALSKAEMHKPSTPANVLASSLRALKMAGERPAARKGDPTAHGGSITVGFSSVIIEGKPAARKGDMHRCPQIGGPSIAPIPHAGGVILTGSRSVLIGGMPAARVGDQAACQGPRDTITQGSRTVLIGN